MKSVTLATPALNFSFLINLGLKSPDPHAKYQTEPMQKSNDTIVIQGAATVQTVLETTSVQPSLWESIKLGLTTMLQIFLNLDFLVVVLANFMHIMR